MSDVTADHQNPSGPLSALGFTFDAESSSLTLAERVFFEWLGIRSLVLSLPDLPDAVKGASDRPVERFQRRRSYLADAHLHISQEHLDRYLMHRTLALAAAGIQDLSARCHSGYVSLAARVTEGSWFSVSASFGARRSAPAMTRRMVVMRSASTLRR